jgi:hypothetical protein
VIAVTHSRPLLAALREVAADRKVELQPIELRKDLGETVVGGREGPLDEPAWRWPSR